MRDSTATLGVRQATDDDLPAVLELLQASLGWVPDDAYERFFAWKHHQSPFGRSPAWVAVDPDAGDRVVGFRTVSRWQFARGDATVPAVRAVDTATHPDYQGRGIFSLLTRQALDELRAAGVAFVFNTPNDRSRPGYFKMGWQLVERLPVASTPRSPLSLLRLARARTPADKWSAPTDAGVPVSEVLADAEATTALLAAARPDDDRLRTLHTPALPELAWRGPLGKVWPGILERVEKVPADGYPTSSLRTDAAEILLRTKGQAYRAQEFERIVLRARPDGARLLLGDVATVIDGFAETDQSARFDGDRSITVQVFRVGDQSALEIAAAPKAVASRRAAPVAASGSPRDTYHADRHTNA